MNTILPLLRSTHKSASQIAQISNDKRRELVLKIADAIESAWKEIVEANQIDADKMEDSNPKKDRLLLDETRIKAIAADSRNVADLEDPTNQVLLERKLENGIELQKISTPLGVVGVIYESRPNVTVDVVVLALKSGNAVVLRGGSDAENSNKAIVKIIHEVLNSFGLDENLVQLLPTDRAFVKELLEAEKYIDIIIPRGSQNLIQFVRENSKIPTIETGAGVCHTFVEKTANLENAQKIVENAKLQRPSVCNSLDTVLVSEEIAADFLPTFLPEFEKYEVEIYADETSHEIFEKANYPFLKRAESEDFGREFLGYGCSVKVVKDLDEALEHIAAYSSKHSETILSEDHELCEKFLREVDAASVYSNASTRFTDGAVFGLGAEIGISTQKLHARGPFALEKLVTEKWILRGSGQVRN